MGAAPQQPAPPSYPPTPPPERTPKDQSLGIAAVVLGSVSIGLCWIPFFNILGIIAGFVGVILGVVGVFASHRIMSIIGAALAFGGIILSISVNNAASSSVTNQVSTPSASASPPTVSGTNAGSPQQSNVATFGQRYTWSSGVAIEVAKPQPFKPSASAAGNRRDRAILVTTTVVNTSKKPYEFNSFTMGPTATHDGQTAPSIVDFGNDSISETPATTILPGKSLTYKAAYSIGATPADLQLEYSEGFEGSPAIFVGVV